MLKVKQPVAAMMVASTPRRPAMAVQTAVLDDQQWEATRESVAQAFIGVSAADFKRNFLAGVYDGDNEPDLLMEVLGYFPELD